MAIGFKNLRSPLLDLQDKILVGKLQGCRVCDVVEDHYEYLIWADKQGLLKFTGLVVETIQQQAGFKVYEQHYREEVEPWVADDPSLLVDDDIPF